MRHLTIFTALLIALNVNGQYDDPCTENFATITASYIAPKSVGLGADYFTEIGLTAGLGSVYTFPKSYVLKQGENEYQMQTNSFDIYAYVGWRLLRIDYTVSVFGNLGYTMGDVEKFQPFTSLKVLFPIGQKAFSVEPVYVVGRGLTGKLSFHIKL